MPLVPGGATAAEARERIGDGDVGVVVDDDGIVLGLLRAEATEVDPSMPVRDLLQPAPSTFRPSMSIKEMVEYFRKSDESRAIITSLTGEWIGMIRRADVIDD